MYCLFVASAALMVWYAWSSFAFWFYGRYLSPFLLIGTVVVTETLLRLAARSSALALLLIGVLGWSVPHDAIASHRRPIEKGNIMYTDQLSMVKALVPEGDCVAAFQSGTLGYFRDCVVNLDGKVNPVAIGRRGDMWRYLDERGVRWLCDWPSLFRFYLGSRPERQGWMAVKTRNKFVLYRRGRRLQDPATVDALRGPSTSFGIEDDGLAQMRYAERSLAHPRNDWDARPSGPKAMRQGPGAAVRQQAAIAP